ncbi:MAG: putative membrane-associated protein [Parcubacteria group bacterium Gr01-1014_20]|nr:MAG: putative membrane-associated protein [Parcubacteria group bacterium Gr01-1014_20]
MPIFAIMVELLQCLMFDIVWLIKAGGYMGIFSIIFAESGLLIGFFLPGDSLLFTAGFLASQGFLDIKTLALLTFLAATLGDSFGYAFGRKMGPKIFNKEDSLFFHRDHLEKSRVFYEKYGKKTIVLARFLPFIRTFAPILAGVGKMEYRTFLTYNILGGLLWAVGLTTLGYFLGSTVPNIDKFLIPIILVIIFSSLLPPIIHVLKSREHRNKITGFIKKRRP